MKATFADSFHFVALLNARDHAHFRALDTMRSLQGKLVTTEFALLEVGDAYSDPLDRPAFLELMDELGASGSAVIVPATSELLQAGLDLFRSRADKGWSLTDCTSFVIMQREGITEALTSDRHFEQAGFVALLK